MQIALVIVVLAQAFVTLGATVNYDWNITWTYANPDGLLTRPVIGINNMWPPPVVNVTKGDRIIAKVYNGLGNESTSIHFHGMYQNGSSHMDGPVGVSQCEIPPGSSFTYNFTVDQIGTYWYHSHHRGQYPDGLRQAMVITDPDNPYLGQYDQEKLVSVSDWYHDQMPTLLKAFVNVKNPTGAEPVPNAALVNDTANFTLGIEAGKTYLFRIVNVGAFASHYIWIEGHSMKIVEVDGIWTTPAETDMIYVTAGQRYSVLVTAKNSTSENYPLVSSMDLDLFDTVPADLNWNATAWLQYDDTSSLPAASYITEFDPYDDFDLVPYDNMSILPAADYTITLDMKMDNLGDGANYAFFNDISYTSPKVPTLYSVMSTGDMATDATVYGGYTNAFVLDKDDIVDIVLNNEDTGKHPFHLHGHAFQAIYRSPENAGAWTNANESQFAATPMRRDTLYVLPTGNFVIRFKADNPGVWFFHCHIDWHLATGLAATMIEAPLELQQTLDIPDSHFAVCNASNTPYVGNAAANTEDLTNLSGQNKMKARLPAGFTAKGIVALVFSTVAAFLGMAVISWYGMASI